MAELAAVQAARWELTARQVLEHLARGLANRAIAHALGCSEKTVELHVSAVLHKAGIESRSGVLARLLARR